MDKLTKSKTFSNSHGAKPGRDSKKESKPKVEDMTATESTSKKSDGADTEEEVREKGSVRRVKAPRNLQKLINKKKKSKSVTKDGDADKKASKEEAVADV